eukprot:CAMPEP_0116024128 /NCGR_PEP_ID=MMETSP0321-20121206/12104_1 /TAXON_ID=163516 /ORGANISM="Leptocylindrus danicus var. danicus, Strain B650" /LENGTH=68 /DNA_ID=CAMNT_0003495743 /DNA_START=58 /DNA_END=264 /DNA_ORIENTATION=+
MTCKYSDYDWVELPTEVQKAAATLGYDNEAWDNDKEPKICDQYWKDLSNDQQAAAAMLGYNESTWNAD